MNSALARSWGDPTLFGSEVRILSQAIWSALLTDASSAASCAFWSGGEAARAAPLSIRVAIRPSRHTLIIIPPCCRSCLFGRPFAEPCQDPVGRVRPMVDPRMRVRRGRRTSGETRLGDHVQPPHGGGM